MQGAAWAFAFAVGSLPGAASALAAAAPPARSTPLAAVVVPHRLAQALVATPPATATADDPTASDGVRRGRERFTVHVSLLVIIAGSVSVGIVLARRDRCLPIRDIPGLAVFEEAVARATEMGRPALFTCGGTCEIRRVQLFASMPLLRSVARFSARLRNRLIVPVAFPETLPVHVNAIRDAYLEADALESFRGEDVRFFPGGQFFFAMAAMGWMLKERPATCFYFGWWEADALMLAETGQTIGAMQIAGTDQFYQVPFFVATCDYTIIGEEFWAASAKSGQDPQLLGSLGAQDVLKLALLAIISGGVLACCQPQLARWMDHWRAVLG